MHGYCIFCGDTLISPTATCSCQTNPSRPWDPEPDPDEDLKTLRAEARRDSQWGIEVKREREASELERPPITTTVAVRLYAMQCRRRRAPANRLGPWLVR